MDLMMLTMAGWGYDINAVPTFIDLHQPSDPLLINLSPLLSDNTINGGTMKLGAIGEAQGS